MMADRRLGQAERFGQVANAGFMAWLGLCDYPFAYCA